MRNKRENIDFPIGKERMSSSEQNELTASMEGMDTWNAFFEVWNSSGNQDNKGMYKSKFLLTAKRSHLQKIIKIETRRFDSSASRFHPRRRSNAPRTEPELKRALQLISPANINAYTHSP
ncbi:hypothetical protein CEXT_612331 [Caerostris extrusa]|uniref:Uncharacterized protein n=1 Tax=Caerostris extrusa TaxID=172846 RepID=A0AAV4PST2_CAEEX|nr:hypothetical protein CEXT_612331 [Caerostris extrusa]